MTGQATVSFANQVCTLANITHVRDYFPTIARKSFPDQEKHLRLLDSIALLLITEAKSDVAAVMFEQTPHEVNFYYSKNRPSTSMERQTLEQLRQIALTVTDINECAMQLLDRVIPTCHKKIVSRLQRLTKSLVPSELIVSEDTNGTFRSHLVERMPHLFPKTGGLSCKNIVLSYFSQVRSIDHAKCSDMTLRKLIRFAFAIGSYKPLGDLITNETVVRRLRKIGNYYGATTGIAKTVSRVRQQHPDRYTINNVRFHEVRNSLSQLQSLLTVWIAGPTTNANDHLHLDRPHSDPEPLQCHMWPCPHHTRRPQSRIPIRLHRRGDQTDASARYTFRPRRMHARHARACIAQRLVVRRNRRL